MDEDTTANLQSETSKATSRIPQLSVRHLMLWTFCSAVYLTVRRVVQALLSDAQGIQVTIGEASSLVHSIISGAVLAGAATLLVTRIRRGPPMLSQPGHWLLFVNAISALIYLPTMIVLLMVSSSFFTNSWFGFVLGTVFSISPVVFSIAAFAEKTRRWRVLFAILSVVALVQCLFYFGLGFQNELGTEISRYLIRFVLPFATIGHQVLAFLILLVSVVERICGQRRDWLHWTGVITHVATATAQIVQSFMA